MTFPPKKIPTPCIGICSTVFGDTVCRGCRRFVHEVIDWNRYTPEQKILVWQRLDRLTEQVMSSRFRIDDPQRLQHHLQASRARPRKDASLLCQLFEVLRQSSGELPAPDLLGASLTPVHHGKSLATLKSEIQSELYALASAHYEMGFLRTRPQPPQS